MMGYFTHFEQGKVEHRDEGRACETCRDALIFEGEVACSTDDGWRGSLHYEEDPYENAERCCLCGEHTWSTFYRVKLHKPAQLPMWGRTYARMLVDGDRSAVRMARLFGLAFDAPSTDRVVSALENLQHTRDLLA